MRGPCVLRIPACALTSSPRAVVANTTTPPARLSRHHGAVVPSNAPPTRLRRDVHLATAAPHHHRRPRHRTPPASAPNGRHRVMPRVLSGGVCFRAFVDTQHAACFRGPPTRCTLRGTWPACWGGDFTETTLPGFTCTWAHRQYMGLAEGFVDTHGASWTPTTLPLPMGRWMLSSTPTTLPLPMGKLLGGGARAWSSGMRVRWRHGLVRNRPRPVRWHSPCRVLGILADTWHVVWLRSLTAGGERIVENRIPTGTQCVPKHTCGSCS